MLLSYINMQLRDNYGSLDEFCAASGEDKSFIISELEGIDYRYNEILNAFK
ncbi:MAG: DUF4250 domain-containing protein [Firmicutes bacterium]|nr:DUF4250 domain-containing protein [Bacillota bacterium]